MRKRWPRHCWRICGCGLFLVGLAGVPGDLATWGGVMLGIAELWESYWSFRAAIASAGVALLTYPEWLPGTIRFVRRKDIGKGHEVAAELDRLYEAAHHIIHSKNSDGMKEAVETYERLRPRYAHLLLPPRVSFSAPGHVRGAPPDQAPRERAAGEAGRAGRHLPPKWVQGGVAESGRRSSRVAGNQGQREAAPMSYQPLSSVWEGVDGGQ